MIGLKRHTVEVVELDPSWTMFALEACQAVRCACGVVLVDVQHIGSTSVPGLPAKPVLDIVAAVVTFDSIPELVRRLTRLGYRYRGDRGNAGGHLFVVESSPGVRTVHLHVVEHGDRQWRNYLRFRDLLRQRPTIRESYAQLKGDLASICRDSRSYTALKADFIQGILARAHDAGDEGPEE